MQKLLLGDCLTHMKEIKTESIDLILTSPPYDNMRSYDTDQRFTFEAFIACAKEMYRLLKFGGVIVWVVGDQIVKGSESLTSFKQALFFNSLSLNLHDTMIYNKLASPFPERIRYTQAFEYMFIFSKGRPKSINLIADKKNSCFNQKVALSERRFDGSLKPYEKKNKTIKEFGIRTNVWQINCGYMKNSLDKESYKHPATFPESLANDHIISWSSENDMVLDPFMGSGTVGKMAKLNNRDFIGIELNVDYFKIAEKRLGSPNQTRRGGE